MPVRVEFVGTGEAFDPRLPNVSLLVEAGGRTLLLDCGFGVPHALWRRPLQPDELDGVYLSHLHADHSFGLPAVLAWMAVAGRTRALDVLVGRGAAGQVQDIVRLGYPGLLDGGTGYAVAYRELSPQAVCTWGAMTLRVAPTRHPRPNLALRLEADGRRLFYSGDGEPTEAALALLDGADLAVCESFWARAPDGDAGHHAAADRLVAEATRRGVRRLALVHVQHGGRADVEAVVRQTASGLDVWLPAPGEVVEL